MKSCGIIVEYNPFHHGHLYHAEQARKRSHADVVIAVMSGNFLQRGEPAIIDKWMRAETAILNGVDLVVELPVEWAVQSADYFAKGAIALLQELGCDTLCFGTDNEETFDYEGFGRFVRQNQGRIQQAFQDFPEKEMNYPQKMTAIYSQLYAPIPTDTPNHILGLSYAKENALYSTPMELLPITRKAAAYHESSIKDQTIASATAIRAAVFSGETIDKVVPEATSRVLAQGSKQNWETYWPLLKYSLLSNSPEQLRRIYQMSEGIEYRLKEAAQQAEDFSSFVRLVKTKRYTWTRIQRICTYLLLHITPEEIRAQQAYTRLHVLGFSTKGQAFLKEKRKQLTVPLITKIGKKEAKESFLTVRSDQIYQLGNKNLLEQTFGRVPLTEMKQKEM